MQFVVGALIIIVILYFVFRLPGSIIAHSLGQCSSIQGNCNNAIWTDSLLFWITSIAITIYFLSRKKGPAVASYDGKIFRINDRVVYNQEVLPSDGLAWMSEDPEQTGHSREVRVEPGKIGTIVKGNYSKAHPTVRWDSQKWRAYDSEIIVLLGSFESSPHVEYLSVIST